jgi:HlyD family secretion protein
LELKPGMTATITATVAQKQDVLLVPNAALRYRPETAAEPARGGGTAVWKVEGQGLTPVPLKLGMTDGVSTEVVSGDLAAGDTLAAASGQVRPGARPQTSASPFSGGGAGRKGRI